MVAFGIALGGMLVVAPGASAGQATGTVHSASPPVAFQPHLKVYPRGILLEVATIEPARVEVSGQVAWGYRPKDGGAKRRLIVGLPTITHEVDKGTTVGFWLALPATVERRLAKLTRAEALTARLSVVITNAAGEPRTHRLTARLPGQR